MIGLSGEDPSLAKKEWSLRISMGLKMPIRRQKSF
jgi:hypothetical protein